MTVAELRYGAESAGWGTVRVRRLERELTRAKIAWPGHALIESYTRLRTWCTNNGHGLGQKDHEADRWIAATALRLGVPLVAHDAIFANVDGLELITKL